MIATAYLRVYIPSIRVAGLPPHRGLNQPRALNLDDDFMWSEELDDDAIYIEWEGDQYACPRNTKLRMLEGVVALSRTDWGSPLIRDDERHAAVVELAQLRRSSAIAQSYILSSAWHVPLRWFAAFHPSEKELYEDSGITSIRYRTTIGSAIDRVSWAATVLESGGFGDQAIDRLNELGAWLSGFKADSMVELDYGRVAILFNQTDLVFDESALDVRESLLALEAGDLAASGEGYQRVVGRWAPAQAHTFTN